MAEQNQSGHEPHGLQGRRGVRAFFLVLAVITVLSYLAFRFLLDIPHT